MVINEVKSAPVEHLASVGLSLSSSDSTLNNPEKGAAPSPLTFSFHSDYLLDSHEVVSVRFSPPTSYTSRTPPCGSASLAKMVEQVDLPDPEYVGKTRAGRDCARIKSRGHRVKLPGLPKRDTSGRFFHLSYRRRESNGDEPKLHSSDGGVPPASLQNWYAVYSSNAPLRAVATSSRENAATGPSQTSLRSAPSPVETSKLRPRPSPSQPHRASASSPRADSAAGPSQPG